MTASTANYMDRVAVARAIELLGEIRERYETIIREFPKSDSMRYYREHVDGLREAIEVLESLRRP